MGTDIAYKPYCVVAKWLTHRALTSTYASSILADAAIFFGGTIMKTKKSGCKFAAQLNRTQIICSKDGSIRSVGKGCPCTVYEPSLWTKIKNIFTLQND